jgi:hypothetical protein
VVVVVVMMMMMVVVVVIAVVAVIGGGGGGGGCGGVGGGGSGLVKKRRTAERIPEAERRLGDHVFGIGGPGRLVDVDGLVVVAYQWGLAQVPGRDIK